MRPFAPLLILVFPLLFCVGICCAPPAENRTLAIGTDALVHSYLDHSDRWTGQRVRLVLPAKSYAVTQNSILWYWGRQDRPPTILFDCQPPESNTKSIIVVGVCKGCYYDNQDRGAGIKFYVFITDCIFE